jgi:imidazolonepropionase-like amidohydrolase
MISTTCTSPRAIRRSNLVYQDTLKYKGIISVNNNKINFSLDPKGSLDGKYWSCSGRLDGKNYYGIGQNQEGATFTWTLTLVEEIRDKKKEEKADSLILMPETKVLYPFVGYGNESMPVAEKVLFKNATLWTNEADGILKETDILIDNGKIVRYGKNLSDAGAKVIDATSKHVTSGVIDEHSHIAISSGVNEGGQESSAEVRIGDVVNSEDVNIYRQLSGGVTSQPAVARFSQSHRRTVSHDQVALGCCAAGSFNQRCRWQFIKFALGENVKQVNWGIQGRNRYPQSRMGVEQVYEDYFSRAQAYISDRKANPNMRRDLDLEAIAEILQAKRFITCHSYQQGEINMLMKVADKYKFRVNTFTHILEGYKVADKMKAHGVGASTFSDWWAYKYEVIDAIPYNGAIMNAVGLVVAFNSDDAEMARRLNQEAGKAVLYGGVPEEEAWKFVTLNPAKLLHLDSHMGSLKAGKDADIVLWSDNPLSIYAVAEQTYVDGIKYFDRAEDKIKQMPPSHRKKCDYYAPWTR